MRLRKLYIKGFKSFADETVINFDERVIGVVGPNGSGKSNIIDAIRWVLGEQKSRDLRLNKMTDVIFNGTKNRKASGLAQVSLTFDNTKNILPTEYASVTVTRLLYRSGESEYRLNDVTCRLKDIHALFIDTGIGSNSYAIIALGMVDDILSNKDNSRRKMFEQAAGVSKFKKRKVETMNKLKLTEADLNRVDDLLYELEQNLKSLEKQAKRTQRYNEVKLDYRESSILFTKRKAIALREKLERLKERKEQESDNYEKQNAALISIEAEVQSLKANNIDKERDLSQFQKELNELINSQRNEEYQKDLLTEKISYNNRRLIEIESGAEKRVSDLTLFQSGISDLHSNKGQVDMTLLQLTNELNVAKREKEDLQANFDSMKSSFDAMTMQKIKASELIQSKETKKAILKDQIESLHTELSNTKNRSQSTLAQLDEKAKEIELIQTDQEKDRANLTQLNDEVAGLVQQQQTITHRIKEHRAQEAKLNRILDSKANEINLLDGMIENLEGFPESIKYLQESWENNAKLLSDVLEPHESIRGVLEQYLDPYLNYYVCDTFESAVEAIKLLNQAQKGKANFFILNQIQNTGSQRQVDSGLQPVTDYVRVEAKYRALLHHLLEDAYIFEGDIQELNALDTTDIDILSHLGTYIKKPKSISGGSVGLFEGTKLGRRKKLEELRLARLAIESDLTNAQQDLQKLVQQEAAIDLSDLEKQIQEVNATINQKDQDIVKLSTELDLQKGRNAEWLGSIERAEKFIIDKTQSISEIEEELININADLASNEDDDEVNDQSLEQLAQTLSKATERYNTLNIEFLKKESELKNIQLEIDYNSQQREQIEEAIAANEKLKIELDKENADSQAQVKIIKDGLLKSYEEKKQFEAKLSGAEQAYFQARNEINVKEDEQKQISRKISECQLNINNIKDKETNIEFSTNSIYERLDLEFGISRDSVDLSDIPEDDERTVTEIELQTNKLKSRFHSFGEVNPLALEAYEEMKIRYDNINSQKLDILQSKDSLIETIKEIEIKATDQYMDAFNRVKANFKEVFRSLFSEDDDCDLILLDGEASPLDANIEIIAKPKGKKPKSLSQLSGGEKTLTATALLFALYLLKPAPFCIFDEVDAPLDDTNVQKFNKIIKKFSERSQFIIVTHNKMTMAEVDVLYGVYMQEQGVSGLSPVDLRNYKYEPILDVVG